MNGVAVLEDVFAVGGMSVGPYLVCQKCVELVGLEDCLAFGVVGGFAAGCK